MASHSVDDLARSFERHLRAGNKSPRTVETYLQAVDQFAAHLRANRRGNGARGTERWWHELAEPPAYRPVATDGAARAAALMAELL